MTFPVLPVTLPADLVGVDNGRLPDSLLVTFNVSGWTRAVRGHRLAVNALKALARDCQEATACILSLSSPGDAYRTYDSQVALFLARYTTVDTGRSSKVWNGVRYYLRPGMAMAATPGTSNHGLGLAFDVAWWNGVSVQGIQGIDRGWRWLLANAGRYGFSWEAQSEPWHIRYCPGDKVPVAVSPKPTMWNQPRTVTDGVVSAPPTSLILAGEADTWGVIACIKFVQHQLGLPETGQWTQAFGDAFNKAFGYRP